MFFGLSDEQRRFVQTVRDLAQREFRPRATQYMDGTFPWENMRALGELGVLGMAVPEEYGGLGLPVFETALVLEEIAKVCYVTAMAVLGEVGVQTRIIATYAPEAIKQRILPAVCSGDCLLAICMTEPDAGTDVAIHLRDLPAHSLKVSDGAAEGFAVLGIFDRLLECPFGEPERDAGVETTLRVEGG